MKKHLAALVAVAAVGFASGVSAQVCPTGTPNLIVPPGNITTSTVWSGHVLLEGPVFVKNGATLTIAAGTVVRGQPRFRAVQANVTQGTPGIIVIESSGRINAQGLATAPIILTSAVTDNDNDGNADDIVQFDIPTQTYLAGSDGRPDPWEVGDTFLDDDCFNAPVAPLNKAGFSNVQLWGGVVVLGNAPTNLAEKQAVGYGKGVIEGFSIPAFPAADVTYGGAQPHDSSGIIRYVSIRHAGDLIGGNNELNGLTLGGVGDGTIIENVEVYCNFDDGFEWFGGTVNGKNLIVSFVGDDMFDIDQGYTGVNQFLFGVMPFFNEGDGTVYADASGDKIAEFDGDDFRPDAPALPDNVNTRVNNLNTVFDAQPSPLSAFAIYNLTAIGTTPDGVGSIQPGTGHSQAATNIGMQWRNGAAGNVFNSVVVDTGAETGVEMSTSLTAGAPGFNPTQNSVNGPAHNRLINLVCSTIDDGAALAAQETQIVDNGNAMHKRLLGLDQAAALPAPNSNAINPASFDLFNDDTLFNPTGNAAGKLDASLKTINNVWTPIDPRLAPGLGRPNGGCAAPRGPGLDTAATYRGAFAGGTPMWLNGWSALSKGGLVQTN